MTRRRWIADEFSPGRAALLGANAAHLARTLRARVGQKFEVACGQQVHRAVVSAVADDRVEFNLFEEVSAAQIVVPITLLLAIFKFDRMEWAIEKCTELNVTCILPVIARRTEKHLAHAADKRAERWRRIAREAAQQSRRTLAPEISEPVKLNAAVEGRPGVSLVLAEAERAAGLPDILQATEKVQSLSLAIGPEGGWTEDEIELFRLSNWISVSLGGTILRSETAAIAALAIARAELG